MGLEVSGWLRDSTWNEVLVGRGNRILKMGVAGRHLDLARHSRSLLAAIVESSDDMIISKGLDGVITSWNDAAERMFGYSAEEMIGESILRLIPEDLHREEDMILARIQRGERIHHFEMAHVRKNGERFPVSVTISPVRDETGRIIGASQIAREVSDRRHGEEVRSRLAAIVESSDDAIVSKSLDGIITSWNEAAERIFGYSAEEMIGQSILRMIPPHLHHEEERILAKLKAGEKIDHFETTRISKSGEMIEVSVTISPVRDQTGRITGASKIARDISERRKMERLLIQSEKLAATGRMAATVAHEINNPLESVMNLIYLARLNSPVHGPVHDYLQTAEAELERVSHIARQTLGYYRETGGPVEIQLHEMLDEVLRVYQIKLRGSGISVDCRYDDGRPVVAHKGELLQVFSNIIANAIDAMPQGGVLRVAVEETTSSDQQGIQVTVKDDGIGIPNEQLKKVFEPFFTTKGNLGTGIGLWVAKELVEKRGGSIGLTSGTDSGRSGTTVRVFLPFVITPH